MNHTSDVWRIGYEVYEWGQAQLCALQYTEEEVLELAEKLCCSVKRLRKYWLLMPEYE